MRKRAGALIIKDKRLLLISENNQKFYWTPGGGLEANETFTEALTREVREELNATIQSATVFTHIIDYEADEEVIYFLVNLGKPPKPNDKRTKLVWYAKSDFQNNGIPISRRLFEKVYPKLTNDGLV